MSRVYKDGAGFVPKKIIAAELDQPAVWENLAKEFDPASLKKHEEEEHHSSSGDHDHVDQKDPLASENSPSFDTDFSSPEPDPAEMSDQNQEDDISEAEDTEPEEQIDLEALAEEYFNKGIQAGIERVESDYQVSIKTLQSVCEELNGIRDTILKNSLDEMKDLVLQIADKIIRFSVSTQNETIVSTVKEALQQAVKSDEFIISVNPQDLKTIQTHSSDFINSISGLENIVIKGDATIEQGGCLIESSNCTVDATLVSQMEIVTDALRKS